MNTPPTQTLFNILVADDEPQLCDCLATMLQAFGYGVETAADGQEAISRINSRPGHFGIVITDSNMPRLSGAEVVRQLRATAAFRGRIIVLSGESSCEIEQKYNSLGVSRVLEKPVNVTGLLAVIEQLRTEVETQGLKMRAFQNERDWLTMR